jgi:hypothetical protein
MALRVRAIANLPCELRANFRAVWLLTVVRRSYERSFRRLPEPSTDQEGTYKPSVSWYASGTPFWTSQLQFIM